VIDIGERLLSVIVLTTPSFVGMTWALWFRDSFVGAIRAQPARVAPAGAAGA
jgi:hypothetical protein